MLRSLWGGCSSTEGRVGADGGERPRSGMGIIVWSRGLMIIVMNSTPGTVITDDDRVQRQVCFGRRVSCRTSASDGVVSKSLDRRVWARGLGLGMGTGIRIGILRCRRQVPNARA